MQASSESARPSIPLAFWVAASLWAGIALIEAAYGSGGTPGPRLAHVPIVVVVARAGLRVPLAGLLLLGLSTGAVLGGAAVVGWRHDVARVAAEHPREHTGVVIDDPALAEHGWRLTLRVDEGVHEGVLLSVTSGGDPPDRGVRLTASGVVVPVDVDGVWARRSLRRGVVGRVGAWRVVEESRATGFRGALLRYRRGVGDSVDAVPGVGRSLLRGMLLGDRRGIPEDVSVDFRSSGLSHLLAVSGLHLGLVALGVGRLLRAIGVGRSLQALGVVLACAGFAALTGAQSSTVRALLMVSVASVGAISGRRLDALGGLSVVAALMLVADPMTAFSVSFRLSVAAVGGLIVFVELARAWLQPLVRIRAVASALAATIVAQVATAPIVGGCFHVISLVAPAANLAAVPVASAALALGILGAASHGVALPVGDALFAASSWLLDRVASIASCAGGIPYASACVPTTSALAWALWALGAVLLWLRWPCPASTSHSLRACLCAVLVLVVALRIGPAGPWLVVADVGQGDAIVLVDDGETMLVDCGPTSGAMAQALGRARVRHVDVLVLTHAHDDHTGGLNALVGTTPVGWVGVPAVADPGQLPVSQERADRLTPRGGVPIVELDAGTSWRVGRTTVRVLWPDEAAPGRETNDTSVILLLERGEWTAILGADAEEGVWRTLVSRGDLADVGVLKVAHHGSENGLDAKALTAMAPELALISVAAENRFGHPHEAALDMLAEAGALVSRTDRSGDLAVPLLATP